MEKFEPIPIYANTLDDDILLMWLRSMEAQPEGAHGIGQSREDTARILAGEAWTRGLLRLAMPAAMKPGLVVADDEAPAALGTAP